jgi:tagatose-6-phosphate ketose/aldose isomerase
VYLVGAGTSDYIGRALTSILRLQWKCDVIAVPSTELVTNIESYVLAERPYLWISFSRSGDSSEGVGALEMALAKYPQVRHMVVSCNQNGRMVELCAGRGNALAVLLDDAVNDRGLAMTSSFTNMVIAGHCLAHFRNLGAYRPTVEALAALGEEMLQGGAAVAKAVSELRCRKVCFVGSGALAAAATECGLKTLELTAGGICPFAESTMGLRHGPMSALDDDSLVVSFVSRDERRKKYEFDLLREIAEKKLGRARVVVAAGDDPELDRLCTHVIRLRGAHVEDDYRVPVDTMIGQMIGLFSSMSAGLQPDTPSPDGVISRVVSHVHIYR